MFQSPEPLLSGCLMVRELCWGLTQYHQTGAMKKVSLSIVKLSFLYSNRTCFSQFSNYCSFGNYFIVLEPLGPRDPYSRDPYFERRSDSYMDRREYSRERESYREKLPPEYERDRYERERYLPRDRDDRYGIYSVALTPFFPNCRVACCFRTYVILFSICLFLDQAHSPWLMKGTMSHCVNTLWSVVSVCQFESKNSVDEANLDNAPPLCRSPLAPPSRSVYRDRERDLRERERSDSRDRDEHYGRPGYDRPPYERTGLDRSGPERYGHSSSPYGMFNPTSVYRRVLAYFSFVW